MSYAILNLSDLPLDGTNRELEGYPYEGVDISIIWVDVPPGHGPRLHKHAYAEVMIIQEGTGTYTVGATTIEAGAGKVLIVPPDTPHSFVNSGDGPLRQIDIHLNKQFVTEWLED
jgi:mannose-6-phosphate isomerase-like protein (cupin superfamily)